LGVEPGEIILAAALASRAEDQDPIDMAVLSGLKDPHATDPYTVTHFQPFDPVHKRTEADVASPSGSHFRVAKGAPQVILAMAPTPISIFPPPKKPWLISPLAASALWASPAPARTDAGNSSGCFLCSIRRATIRGR